MTEEFELPPRPELPEREEPIGVGERGHDFTLPAAATDGELFHLTLSEYLGGSRGLLVFYQDDGMPICTSELKAFGQEWDTISGADIQVVGINTNGIGSHQKFQERDAFPFPLVSDFHGDVVKAYGMWDPDEGKSRRAVVAVKPDLEVQYVLPHFNPGNINAFAEIFDALGLV